jgi:EAL domain-containing protein (putative c-di-GMP-specific phosphodiesterase class I)
MHVNVSTRQFERDELVSDVRSALGQARLDPSALTLEVTETGLMQDPELVAERLGSLKALGIEIAIDDFGTGYSSLAYLARFPASVLKIDRSFISGMADSPESGAALIHTLIRLGKSLGLKTLGEGIESDAQLELLRSEDCDLGQGFLFAHPLSADAVGQLLGEGHARGGELSASAEGRPAVLS